MSRPPVTTNAPRSALALGLGFVATAVLALFLTACSHYRLGPGGAPTFTTLYIEPVENSTLLPQAVAVMSTQLRESFIRDGRVTVVNSAGEADATLSLRLGSYRREVATVLANDTGRARKFNLTLEATATLRDNRSGAVLFRDRPLTTHREIFTDNPTSAGSFDNQQPAEYQALPLLAESLAKSASHAVLDVW